MCKLESLSFHKTLYYFHQCVNIKSDLLLQITVHCKSQMYHIVDVAIVVVDICVNPDNVIG